MRLPIRSAFLLFFLLCGSAALAQPFFFGELFPVANTRYGSAPGTPLLVSNGQDVFLVWSAGSRVLITRHVSGEGRVGRPVLPMHVTSFDAVWTGTHFLVIGQHSITNTIYGRIVDRNGEPRGDAFAIVQGERPKVAFNGTHVLLLYERTGARSLLLTPHGQTTATPSQAVGGGLVVEAASAGGTFAGITTSGGISHVHLFTDAGVLRSTQEIGNGAATIASDGARYLLALAGDDQVTARVLETNGALSAPMTIDTSSRRVRPQAVWNGTAWTIAYTSFDTPTQDVQRMVHLNWPARLVALRLTSSGHQVISLLAGSGGVLAAYRDATDTISIGTFPLRNGRGQPVSFTAGVQRLITAASSANAILFVWHETIDGQTTQRAGVRTRDGRWNETQLAGTVLLAASDGHDFTIVVVNAGVFAVRMDENAQLIGAPASLPFPPQAMAWNGANFGLVAIVNGAFRGALLTAGGTVSPPLTIQTIPSTGSPALASDGNGFYLTWSILGPTSGCITLCVGPRSVSGVRLTSTLDKLEPVVDFVTNTDTSESHVVWTGTQYAVVWKAGTRINAALVGEGPSARFFTIVQGANLHLRDVSPAAGSAAILWMVAGTARTDLVTVLRDTGTIAQHAIVYENRDATSEGRLVPLADGGVAYANSFINDAPPHHGVSRVMMATGSPVPLSRPDPPRGTIRVANGLATIEWSAPPQAVDGYRVEYRVANGAWNEFEAWLGPDDRTFQALLPSQQALVTFRVRAFNDAGASAYSDVLYVNPSRRRAVR